MADEGAAEPGVTISAVRIAMFRCIEETEVRLGPLTVLLGANSSGKTLFLDALQMALGVGRTNVGREDIWLAAGEADVPQDRRAVVDILIHPVNGDGHRADVFPGADFWTDLWGDGISQDDDGRDFVGIRACLRFSASHGEHRVERHFLKEWTGTGDWKEAETKERVSAAHLEPIAIHYIDAQRDLCDDLRVRSSFWRRLTDDLGLTLEEVANLEAMLSEVNRSISERSAVLQHLGEKLREIGAVLPGHGQTVAISPVASRLRDVSRGLDVSVASGSTQSFPLLRHGMGIRSLASLLVFRAFAEWKRQEAGKMGDATHTLLGLEEPEAHLHPQAQRSLFRQIREIPGQRIVSTHSPYFAGQAALEELRLFRRENGKSYCTALDLSKVNAENRRKLEQVVIATRGDILFSRAIVLFEGVTEEQALPIIAGGHWSASVHELGLSLVGVGGDNNYYSFIWLAHSFGIPWFILSDGEPKVIAAVEDQLRRAGCKPIAENASVVVLPRETDIEGYPVAEGYMPQVEAALAAWSGEAKFLDGYIEQHNGLPKKKGFIRDYSGPDGRRTAILDVMRENKAALAPHIGHRIATDLKAGIIDLPNAIRDLFHRIESELALMSPLSGEA